MIWTLIVVVPVLLFMLFIVGCLFIYFSIPSRRDFDLFKKHALVTGGSKGIGYQIAASLVARGSNVTIIARKKADLEKAAEKLQKIADGRGQHQKIQWRALDMCSGYENIKKVIDDAVKDFGPVDVLINNAGVSVQARFEELPVTDFAAQMETNYLSAVYATRAVVESMKSRKTGHISYVSSAAGQFAIFGYTAYSPSKFAIRGFADALHMELLPYKVNVALLYPPNTDTEGFKVEQETMPEEVRLISESAGLFTPEYVAEKHVEDIVDGQYCTSIGLEGWMLATSTAGACPEKSLWRALAQIFTSGLFRGISLVFLGYFNGICKKAYKRRLLEESETEDDKKSE